MSRENHVRSAGRGAPWRSGAEGSGTRLLAAACAVPGHRDAARGQRWGRKVTSAGTGANRDQPREGPHSSDVQRAFPTKRRRGPSARNPAHWSVCKGKGRGEERRGGGGGVTSRPRHLPVKVTDAPRPPRYVTGRRRHWPRDRIWRGRGGGATVARAQCGAAILLPPPLGQAAAAAAGPRGAFPSARQRLGGRTRTWTRTGTRT